MRVGERCARHVEKLTTALVCEPSEPQARQCVLLAYCSGYSREELAERFGRPVNTIKTLLHRSLKTLLGCMDAE